MIEIENEAFLSIYYDFPDWSLDISYTGKPTLYSISYANEHIWNVHIYDGNSHLHELDDYPPPEFALDFVKTIRLVK